MPRRIINNERDAAKLLADAVIKTMKDEMPASNLQNITNGLSTYGNLQKQFREAVQTRKYQAERQALKEEIDMVSEDSLGLKLELYKKLYDIKIK